MTVYRDHNDSLPHELLCGATHKVWAGGGCIIRKVECRRPGWWQRFLNSVRVGDIWECEKCSKTYRWTEHCGWAVEKQPERTNEH